ncbi:ubiquinone biosynthesis monooxygenase COQ6, mitochondrial isoform X2 [Danaus plexippus]|nr:ubiquinone biosynthesis monooxygenase COQ6, mitochondrial isoform X2 [Danaus plexippus]
MVGCALACAMGKNPLLSQLKVLLLEGSPNKKFEFKPEYSNRVVALNGKTKSLMNSLKVWQHVENMRLQPVRYMQVWDACSDALISFSSSEIFDDDLAYIVENDVLLEAINKELKSKDVKNVEIVYGAKIGGYELAKNDSPKNIVKMSNGDSYICDLLIGADGAKSAVREAMGVQYLSWNYDQMGVVATVRLAESTDNTTAWQRFLPTGPVALLPLNSDYSSLVWSTTHENAKQLLNMPEENFIDSLNDALWKQYPRSGAVDACMSWLGSVLRSVGLPDGAERQLPPSVATLAPSSRAAFPLGFGHSTRYVAPNVALVGDAAHRVHPLAGQGVNLGFGDVKDLTDFLSDALYGGLDVSHNDWLEKYESARQRHNVPMQLAVDALYRLYGADLPPVVLARSVGLQLTNAIHPLKKILMSQATT